MTSPVMLSRKSKNEGEDNEGDGSLFFGGKNKDPKLRAKVH